MYNNYTPLQQRQLALQEYSNTQSTYLLVCASARSTALKATLTDQLHRKFRLVDRLGGELTASVDGVLLAAEDVELMSTALMFFAKALKDGADYAVCNAVFGFGGATALYQSQPLQAQNRCAVVSRTLLERCRAAAHDPENGTCRGSRHWFTMRSSLQSIRFVCLWCRIISHSLIWILISESVTRQSLSLC